MGGSEYMSVNKLQPTSMALNIDVIFLLPEETKSST